MMRKTLPIAFTLALASLPVLAQHEWSYSGEGGRTTGPRSMPST